jgi:DNA-binding winged helix-turn-helix (wHTH) protein
VGNFKFYASLNELRTDDKTITLSEKETKALDIFVQNINQVVDRDTLMKTLWEAEGTVVISRNVDVLVSKLRKKLSDDDSLKLVNVPGRGYKLMLSGG